MNDQQFVNAYIRLLNESLGEAFNKNLVLQAQLEVSKQNGNKTAELEAKIKELTNVSSDNNALLSQLNSLKAQLDQANANLNTKNGHVETFKKEVVESRSQLKNAIANHAAEIEAIKTNHSTEISTLKAKHVVEVESLNAKIELLNRENEELRSKKKKAGKALNNIENSIFISDNSTF